MHRSRHLKAQHDRVCENCKKPFKAKQKITRFCYEEECIQERYQRNLANRRVQSV